MAVERGEGIGTATPGPQVRRRRSKWFWYTLIGLLVLGVVIMLSLRAHWRAEFYERVEAIRAAGYPVTPQELDAWYPWPQSGKNAADWILGAVTYYQAPGSEDFGVLQRILSLGKDAPARSEPLADDVKTLLTAYLQANAKTLGLLHEAAAIAECRYPLQIVRGYGGFNDTRFADVRNLLRLLCFEAVRRAEEGDSAGAVRNVQDVLRLSDSFLNEPLQISQLVRIAGQGLALSGLERVLSRAVLTDDQLQELAGTVVAAYKPEGIVRGLVGERCTMAHFLGDPVKADRRMCAEFAPLPIIEAYHALGLAHREGTVQLDLMAAMLDAMDLPPPQRQSALKAAEAQVRSGMHGCLFLRSLLPSGRVIIQDLRTLARIRAATAAIAVERYRLANARFPDELGQLVPAYLESIPQDPFDGAPLRYKLLDPGFVVYSVDEDGGDDGGREQNREGTRDVPFTVQR